MRSPTRKRSSRILTLHLRAFLAADRGGRRLKRRPVFPLSCFPDPVSCPAIYRQAISAIIGSPVVFGAATLPNRTLVTSFFPFRTRPKKADTMPRSRAERFAHHERGLSCGCFPKCVTRYRGKLPERTKLSEVGGRPRGRPKKMLNGL